MPLTIVRKPLITVREPLQGLSLQRYIDYARTLPGLVGVWPLNGANGKDFSSNANHLTASASSPTTALGPGGHLQQATQFTRANSQNYSHADNASLSVGDIPFAGFAWVYLDSKPAGGFQTLASHWKGGGIGQSSWVATYATTADRFRLISEYNAAGVLDSVTVSANSLGSPALATWYFVSWWHDPDANTLNMQVNNGPVDSITRNGGCVNSTAAFRVGAVDDPGSYLNGRLAGVVMTKNYIPTSNERKNLYNAVRIT